MASEWRTERFGCMAQLVRDTVHPTEATGLSYVGLEHIGEGSLSLIGTGRAEDATSTKTRFRKGDILFGKLRPYFRKVIRAPFDGICSTDIWVIRPRVGIDASFLFYLMASDLFLEPVVRASEGTKMPRAKWDYAESLVLLLPPLPEQRAIARILGTLDDKIEANRRMNETLEAIARALFTSWFVDFDPVRAKAEGREPAGMDAETAALFPDSFEETELGEVPKGWEVKTVGDVLELAYGKALKEENRIKGDIPVFGSNGQVGWHSEKLVDGPGIIVGRKGNPGVVTWSSKDFFPIDTTFYVILKGLCKSMYYVFYSLQQQELASLGADSAVPGLNRNLAYMSQMIIPSSNILELFDKQASILTFFTHVNKEQSLTLSTIRDLLLPKLLSGQIPIKDAEQWMRHAR